VRVRVPLRQLLLIRSEALVLHGGFGFARDSAEPRRQRFIRSSPTIGPTARSHFLFFIISYD
jgi:hypothetical protein|tara:strand:+ start:3078 stop:3263 length:186 start_codon:yes stop_codon:yes gene_type:complete